MAEQVQKLLKYAQKNPDLLNKALVFAENNAELLQKAPAIAQSFLSGSPSGLSGAAPMQEAVTSSIQEVASTENVTSSLADVSSFFKIKNIIIIALIVWAVMIISARFYIKNEETKRDLEFVNTTLFGNSGIIPIILTVWVLSVVAVTLLPAMTGMFPKLGGLADALSTFLTQLPKLIPLLV